MIELLRLLWPFTRGQRRAFAGGVGGIILVTVAELVRPVPLALVVDRLLDDGAESAASARFLAGVAALVVAVAAAGALGTYLSETGLRRAGEHVVHELRVALYAHLQRLSLRFHGRRHPGDLVTRLTGDVHAVGELVAESFVKVTGALLLLVGMLAVSLAIDPVLTAVAASITPLLAFATVRSRRAIKAAARRQRAAEGQIAAMSTETLTAIGTVKALGNEPEEEQRLRRRSEERRDAGVAGSTVEGRMGGLVDLVEALGSALVLVVGVLRVAAGALSAGDLVIMYAYVRRLYRPIRDLSRQAGRVARAQARAERIAEILAADDTLSERRHPFATGHATGHLTLRDVRFAYDGRPPALAGVTLDVPPGTTLAVVGPSGAGKSTLAALIGRFYDPDAGAVLLDGRDLRDCSLSWLRAQVGFVLQETALFSGTVADNIAYGTDATPDQVKAAARSADAHEFIEALPDGYDTDLGPGGASLSGGQRQRLAVARALVRDPPVVVLDEPTAGLDAASETVVLTSLLRLGQDRTTILITHSLRLLQRADAVAVLEHGRVVERGTPEAAAPKLPTPADPALDRLSALFDPEAVASALQTDLDHHLHIDAVSVRYVRYKPATNAVVDYDIITRHDTYRAVLMVAADRDLAKRAARPDSLTLAAKVHDRTPSRRPLHYNHDLGALVQWLPLDLWLPALAEPPAALASTAGIHLGDHAVTMLAYKPRRRAVLRIDDYVLKLYADEPAFQAAAAALLEASRLPLRTPVAAGIGTRLQLTAQRVMDGAPVTDPFAAAEEAGSLLAALHPSPHFIGIRRLDPLTGAMASASTIAALVPDLRQRVERLVAKLAAAPPASGDALCHGDFHAGQLLLTPGGLAVLDLDELGVGAPAIDLATFAAHAVPGDGTDRFDEVLDALLAGYGTRPADLDWHGAVALLRRAVVPFRNQPTPEWPARVQAMVATAESVLAA